MSVMSVPIRFMPRIRTKRRRTKTAIQPQAPTRLRACTKPRVTATKETAYRTAHGRFSPGWAFLFGIGAELQFPKKNRSFEFYRGKPAAQTNLDGVDPWN